jgi:cobaltochelatase CobS
VFLVGPAASGKSTIARQIAEDMGLPCYTESGHELLTAYDLLGFATANGDHKVTKLNRAIEFGGVFLMDEMDAMNAAALVAINNVAALRAGEKVWLGDREITVHPDFHMIGGGNTWGRGANGAYVTRQVIDAATLDRFACIEFGYDAHLEYLSAGIPVPANVPVPPRYKRGSAVTDADVTAWVSDVQRYRDAFLSAGIEDAMVTPRASIMGAKMLRAGIHADYVLASLVRKGLSDDEWRSVKAHMPAVNAFA